MVYGVYGKRFSFNPQFFVLTANYSTTDGVHWLIANFQQMSFLRRPWIKSSEINNIVTPNLQPEYNNFVFSWYQYGSGGIDNSLAQMNYSGFSYHWNILG